VPSLLRIALPKAKGWITQKPDATATLCKTNFN
jgi:hypothetical protein